MAKLDLKTKWVLVTGASSGLGRAVALYLAKHEHANLILSARRSDRLEELKTEIKAACNADVRVFQADLACDADVRKLFEFAVQKDDLFAIVNNAGVTFYGPANVENLDQFERIITVNFRSLMTLSLLALDYFKKKGGGAILNITSEASFVPIPYQAVYSATKHAAQSFTEALYQENRGSDVLISSFAPGGIATEMLSISGLDKKHPADSPFNMDAAKCARLAVKSFKKKKFHSIPGFVNKLTVFLVRFFPRKLVASATELVYRPIKEKGEK